MSFTEVIKRSKTIRRIGKSLKIYKEFLNDAHGFSSSYIEAAEEKENYKYSILLLVHSLEKGMCMPSPRPFGGSKVEKLIELIKNYQGDSSDFEYKIAVETLFSWKKFYEKHGWSNEKTYQEVNDFLTSYNEPEFVTGSKRYSYKAFPQEEINGQFSRIPMSLSLTSRPLTLCRKSVGMSDATRTAGAKQLPSQACFIVPIAAARCMSTVPTTASVFLNIPVPNTAKSQLESSARHSTVSMKMWYCPLFPKCSKPLPSMRSMTEPSLSEWYRKRSPASRQQRLRNSGYALPPQSRECPSWKSCSVKSMRTTF